MVVSTGYPHPDSSLATPLLTVSSSCWTSPKGQSNLTTRPLAGVPAAVADMPVEDIVADPQGSGQLYSQDLVVTAGMLAAVSYPIVV